MATLTSTKIKDTYAGLIKTNNNTAISATNQYLTDGQGNASPLSLGTENVRVASELNVGLNTATNGNIILE